MDNKNWKLDSEEQELLDSFKKGEWISTTEDLDKYKQAAKKTRLSQQNPENIK